MYFPRAAVHVAEDAAQGPCDTQSTYDQMKAFDPKRFVGATVPLGVSWQLGTVMEAKGRQELYEKQRPEALRTLRELEIVESAESSKWIQRLTVGPALRHHAGQYSEVLGKRLAFL